MCLPCAQYKAPQTPGPSYCHGSHCAQHDARHMVKLSRTGLEGLAAPQRPEKMWMEHCASE